MDFEWVAIALGDVVWICIAFALGLVSRVVGLPPLVGFLATGFILKSYGFSGGEMLEKLADLGITLLLFTVGLKLNLKTLGRAHVWGVATTHAAVVVAVCGLSIWVLALLGVQFLAGTDFARAALIAFALSFSSTVFVVKVLEEKGEVSSRHGRIAIGILIVQDLAAVVFMAISVAKLPTPWALLVLLLIPARPAILWLLKRVGHGELLVLYGFLLAIGGAELFETVGLKGDLGALALGVLIASHPKADELAKTMLGFKDLFLLGFFLSIGMSGQLTIEAFAIGAILTPFVLIKSALFFALLTAFRLRARTALLASLSLGNYSEFGLIVAAVGVSNGWIHEDWLIVIAVALSLSFVVAAALNMSAHGVYRRYRSRWKGMERSERLSDDRQFEIQGARIAVIGMGGIGTGSYDTLVALHGDDVVGVDNDPVTARNQRDEGRNVLQGDPGDSDFWDRFEAMQDLELVLLTLPRLSTGLAVIERLRSGPFSGRIAAIAKFPDEEGALRSAGADTVFNIYTEAGVALAAQALGKSPGP